MQGDPKVDELMRPVRAAIERHVKDSDAKTDIYNRAYEALMISMEVNKSRAEKAEAKVKELREELDKDNSYFEDIYTALEMEDFAPSCIPEINKLKGRNFELEQSVIELESSLAALREQTRWRLFPKEKPSNNQWVWFLDHFGSIHKYNYHNDIVVDSTYVFWRPVEIPDLRPIDLPDADKESE